MSHNDPEKHSFDFEAPGWRVSARGLGLVVVVLVAVLVCLYQLAA